MPDNGSANCSAWTEHAANLLHDGRHTSVLSGRRALLISIILCCAALVIIVALGPVLHGAAVRTDFTLKGFGPSLAHLFGTDWMGRDMLARTLCGLSTSIYIGLIAALASSVIAFLLASLAAFGGRCADAAVCWFIDLAMGVPHIVLLVLISYALGRGALGVFVGISVTHWPGLTRVLRAEMLQVRSEPHIQCARSLGSSWPAIAFRHILPAVLPQFVVGLVLLFPHAILHEASITFLGFGLSPEEPAIGVILSEAMGYLSSGSWWLAVFPGLALLLTVLLFEKVGSSLRTLISKKGVQL